MRLLARSQRAARFALGFAVHRMDLDAEVIHEAALLHDFAEMLLWCHAPALALEIEQRQQADPTCARPPCSEQVLGVELVDVQQALMRGWRLPELLVRISDDHHDKAASGQERGAGDPPGAPHEGWLGQRRQFPTTCATSPSCSI